jgi:hypothetical protein
MDYLKFILEYLHDYYRKMTGLDKLTGKDLEDKWKIFEKK